MRAPLMVAHSSAWRHVTGIFQRATAGFGQDFQRAAVALVLQRGAAWR